MATSKEKKWLCDKATHPWIGKALCSIEFRVFECPNFVSIHAYRYVFKALCCPKCRGKSYIISETEALCDACGHKYDCRQQTLTLISTLQNLENLETLPHKSGESLDIGSVWLKGSKGGLSLLG